jgi:hypothetical protein
MNVPLLWLTNTRVPRASILYKNASLSANAGMSLKTCPSANNASSLSILRFSFLFSFVPFSASSQGNLFCSVSGEIWLAGAVSPVSES